MLHEDYLHAHCKGTQGLRERAVGQYLPLGTVVYESIVSLFVDP